MNTTKAFENLMDRLATLESNGIECKKGQITVSELIAKLQYMEDIGCGDYVVWFRNRDSMDEKVEQGVWDCSHGTKSIALG